MLRSVCRLRSRPVEPEFDLAGVAVIESRHSADYDMAWRTDSYLKILTITAGSGWLLSGKERAPLVAPCVVVVPAAISHRVEDQKGQPLSLCALCLKPTTFPPPELLLRFGSTCSIFAAEHLVGTSIGMLRRFLFESRRSSPESTALRLALATELVVLLLRQNNCVQKRPRSVRSKIQEYVTELSQSFWNHESLDDAARRLALSRRAFSTHFRASTGRSWQKYRRDLRLAHARSLLEQTDLPIKAIAFECGYDDLAHFYREFTRHNQLPPATWRRQQEPPAGPLAGS